MARDINGDWPSPEPKPRPRPTTPKPAPSPLPPRPIPSTTQPPAPSPTSGGKPAPPRIRSPKTSETLRVNALKAYIKTGGVGGPLGFPVEPILLSGNNAYWNFSSGYLVAGVNGPQEIIIDQHLEVTYLGYHCLAESDWDQGSSSDEPYFVVSFAGTATTVSRVFSYRKVDSGESERTPSILVSGAPVATSILHAVGMESDFGSQQQALEKVEQEMKNVTGAALQAASVYDLASTGGANAKDLNLYSTIAGAVVGGPLGALVARGLVGGLDLADDYIKQDGATLFSKEVGYRDPPIKGQFWDENWTHKLYLDGGDEGKYDLYFRVLIVRDPRPWAGGDMPPNYSGGTGILADRGKAAVM